MAGMRTAGLVAGLVVGAVAIACSGGPDGGASSGAASSSSGGSSSGGSSSSSSSGGSGGSGQLISTTTCAPELPSTFFDGATIDEAAALSGAPCPPGYREKPADGSIPPSPKRYANEAELVADHCEIDPKDAGASGSPIIDYATSDVIAAGIPGFGTLPVLLVGGERWIRRSDNRCGGADPGESVAFYVLPKGEELKVHACTTVCTCTGDPCNLPP